MLLELHIESLGVIDRLDMVLGPGLTALTGETGAGKTMLVEAISLLVGGRADASMMRPGAAEARIEGRFVLDGDEHVVARVVPVDGRSRAYVNGRLATVANLAELGARAVDLHGQHSHQSLLSSAHQRDALDRYCRTDLSGLRTARGRLTEIDAALAALGGDSRARAREVDLLRFQVGELIAAGLEDPDEEERLEHELDLLSGAVDHREAAFRAVAQLSDDDGATDAIGAAVHMLGTRVPFAELAARLRGLAADLADLAGELRSRGEAIEEDPVRLAEVGERRQLLRDLRRKYGDSLADVMTYRDEAVARLAELEGYEERVAALEHERLAAEEAERRAAAEVGAQRRAGAGALAREVQHHLRTLAMAHAQVEVAVGDDDPGDDVRFLLSANPGAPLLPLARVASGGELARAMLALRLVLTEAPETLLFDEVDAGIGGAAAQAVGESLARLGGRHQVLVVTHLAQVAALADRQVVVTKRVIGGTTVAEAAVVDGDARIEEIARMLSGLSATDSARRHAADLLGDRVRRSRP
jgi:DNA repair protein RecN (Recombination protein N)